MLLDTEDAHPLQREAYIEDIWPCLQCCREKCIGKRKPYFRNALKLCLHLEMDLKTTQYVRSIEIRDEAETHKDDEDQKDHHHLVREDPFL